MKSDYVARCHRLPPIDRKRPRKHALPKGWRWLNLGERVQAGDMTCDPRCNPVMAMTREQLLRYHPPKDSFERIGPDYWTIADGCHPVRRRL